MSDFLIVTVTPTPAARLELEKAARAIGGEVLSFIPGQVGVQWCAWRDTDGLAVVLREAGFGLAYPGLDLPGRSVSDVMGAVAVGIEWCDRRIKFVTDLNELWASQRETQKIGRHQRHVELVAAVRAELEAVLEKLEEAAL